MERPILTVGSSPLAISRRTDLTHKSSFSAAVGIEISIATSSTAQRASGAKSTASCNLDAPLLYGRQSGSLALPKLFEPLPAVVLPRWNPRCLFFFLSHHHTPTS
jgi:hypothetical protein